MASPLPSPPLPPLALPISILFCISWKLIDGVAVRKHLGPSRASAARYTAALDQIARTQLLNIGPVLHHSRRTGRRALRIICILNHPGLVLCAQTITRLQLSMRWKSVSGKQTKYAFAVQLK